MNATIKTAGFYGTDSENYYLTPAGKTWAFGSGDFDGVREIAEMPENATSTDGLTTPDEAIDILRQIEVEGGETLVETAE
jgi:hypothetical protein